MPSTSERFESKKNGEKKKECSKNLPGTSERKTKKCDKSKSKGNEKDLKENVLTRGEKLKRKTKNVMNQRPKVGVVKQV